MQPTHYQVSADRRALITYALTMVERLCTIAVFTILLIAAIPWSPVFPSLGLDQSWSWAVNAAAGQHLHFGTDFIFSFGPLAAIYTHQYEPGIEWLVVLGSGLIAVALGLGIVLVAGRAFGLVLALAIAGSPLRDPIFFILPVLGIFLAAQVRERPLPIHRTALTVLAAALGLGGTVKLSFLAPAGVGIVCVIALLIRVSKRDCLLYAAAFVLTPLSFWLLVGQPLSGMPGYLISGASIVSGYTEAMSIDGTQSEIVWYVAGFLGLLFAFAASARMARKKRAFIAAVLAVLGWVTLKAAFVRHDEHAAIASAYLLFFALVVGTLVPRAMAVLAVLVAIAIDAQIEGKYGLRSPYGALSGFPVALPSQWSGLVQRLQDREWAGKQYAAVVQTIAARAPVPTRNGAWDIYPLEQSAVLANRVPWSPRPVIQSYKAYTKSLLTANADHLKSAKAPQNILFGVNPIDGRLPMLDDSLSWPVLLGLYAGEGFEPGFEILRRRAIGRPADLGPIILDQDFSPPSPIELPANPSVIWAEVTWRLTLLGRIAETLFKVPEAHVTYVMTDGSTRAFRYIPSIGSAGFIVAPLVQSVKDFSWLPTPVLADALPRPVQIVFNQNTAWGMWMRQGRAHITLRALNIPSAGSQHWPMAEPQPDDRLVVSAVSGQSQCVVDAINGQKPEDGQTVRANVLDVTGWAAMNATAGIGADATYLILTGEDGRNSVFRAEPAIRPDVAAYYSRPSLENAGFWVTVDSSGLSGSYKLRLLAVKDGRSEWCSATSKVNFPAQPMSQPRAP
jgi:hypothetical protein